MNYLELINNFWKLDEGWQFSCCETRLYFYLIKTANGLGWENSWTHSDDKTAANVGVSPNSMKKARNRLVQAGLILFKEGGKGFASKTRYQILIPNLQPKLIPKYAPNLQPKYDPLINKLNKTKLKNNNPPTPLKGDDVVFEKSWRDDFEIYKSDLRTAYLNLIDNQEFINKQERYHPGLNIQLSIEKACVNYWAIEAGWKKKKASKTVTIDWKTTFINALDIKSNQVWKTKEQQEYERQKTTTIVD